jgi:hypothetical protein
MKFSWEIVRLILLDYEYSDIDKTNDKTLENSLTDWGEIHEKLSQIPDNIRTYHEALLMNQGLAEGVKHRGSEGKYAITKILNLTIPGHELADFLRSKNFSTLKIWVLRRKYAIDGVQKLICGVLSLIKAAIAVGIKIP